MMDNDNDNVVDMASQRRRLVIGFFLALIFSSHSISAGVDLNCIPQDSQKILWVIK
jgi:hypothetical protein